MKRLFFGPIVVLLLAAVACLPPPPPGSTTPEITEVVVTPHPVVAGEPFTVRVSATDDEIVDEARIVIQPRYAIDGHAPKPYEHVECDDPPITPAEVVTVQYTCTMAEFSPNGEWSLEVHVGHQGSSYEAREIHTVELTGGSEDREPPVLESLVISPDPIVRGEPYSITMRLSDQHLTLEPRSIGLANESYVLDPDAPPRVYWPCGEVAPTLVGPNAMELHWENCIIGTDAVLGNYYTYFEVTDQIGHPTSFYPGAQVVPAP